MIDRDDYRCPRAVGDAVGICQGVIAGQFAAGINLPRVRRRRSGRELGEDVGLLQRCQELAQVLFFSFVHGPSVGVPRRVHERVCRFADGPAESSPPHLSVGSGSQGG
ncbi:hypothetical protein [Streptomyces sp. NPDC051577]|uniref:hypothetical protein n=1 Tax=Streptomyces sp. NPDC051577 TaxID=3155166 RepID=UPI00342A2C37